MNGGSLVAAGARLVAFVATSDLDAARRFYGDVLGLELIEVTLFACVFDGGGTTLRVTVVAGGAVAPAGYTVVGWDVADVDAAVAALTARGVAFRRYEGMDQDAAGVWTSPSGSRVAWFTDPDGNVLSVQQHPG